MCKSVNLAKKKKKVYRSSAGEKFKFWKVFENEEYHHNLILRQLKYRNSLIWMKICESVNLVKKKKKSQQVRDG